MCFPEIKEVSHDWHMSPDLSKVAETAAICSVLQATKHAELGCLIPSMIMWAPASKQSSR